MRSSFAPKLIVFGLVAAVALASVVFALWPRDEPPPAAERYAYAIADAGALPQLWQIPDFAYRDQHGAAQTAATLRGQPSIVDFIFTQCTSACPMMTSRFVLLQRELAGVPLRFVSFSVDPAHDSPEVLARYAQSWNANEPRWLLLATEAEALHKTLHGFRVTAKPTPDPAEPIVHSSVFLLVDGEGWVRGVYESEDTKARQRLVADARSLAAPATTASIASASMAALGCAGCHADPRIAPALGNVFGAQVQLQNGMNLIADEAYLRRALTDPNAELVAGYSPLMPSYAHLDAAALDALVAEMRGPLDASAPTAHHVGARPAARGLDAGVHEPLASVDASAPAAAAIVEDPICHMSVRAVPETLHVQHEGHDVYFCSSMCRDSFLANAAKRSAEAGAP